MDADRITINRAPVLTLWAAIVAERLGYTRDEALTFGRAVAGLNAYSKGRSLGIIDADAEPEARPDRREEQGRARQAPEGPNVKLLGRSVPAVQTERGLRATANGEAINPASVERYLAGKFRDRLEDARTAMAELAGSLPPEELARRAYDLYEQFRPAVPAGTRGWGASGELDLDRLRSMARRTVS